MKYKKTFYKVICEEFPKGAVFKRKEDALNFSEESRKNEQKATTRMVRMTQEEFDALPEIG